MNLMDLYSIAECDGIDVNCFPLHKRDSVAFQDNDGVCYIAIDPFKLSSTADERVKLAHELGHCETGAFYNRYSPYDIRGKHEIRARRWAVRQLVPRSDLERAVLHGLTEVWELADYFQVTEAFMQTAMDYYRTGEENPDGQYHQAPE